MKKQTEMHDDRAILKVIQQERGRVKCNDFHRLKYLAWTEYKKQANIIDVYLDSQEVYVELEDRYNISDYVDNYINAVAEIIADEADSNDAFSDIRSAIESDDFDLVEYVESKGLNYWELTASAEPSFDYNYGALRFLAENWTDMELDSITRNGGDFMDNIKFACREAIIEMASNGDLIERIKDKLTKGA